MDEKRTRKKRPKRISAGDAAITLYNEDCVKGMISRLLKESVDVIVTSPPYNLGTNYSRYQDAIPRNQYLAWTTRWLASARTVLKQEGSLFLNVGAKPSDPWGPFEVAFAARGFFHLQNVIHWIKSIHIPKASTGGYGLVNDDLTVGHYQPINSTRFLNDCHEYIFHFTKSGRVPLDRIALGVPYQDKSNIGRWKRAASGFHCRGNTWFIPYRTIQDRKRDRPHPASYPAELAEMCIRLHGIERGQLVLDPFTGIGNTAVTCARLGINFVGFEIDPSYLQQAVHRISQETEGKKRP
ncbi:MAG: site-specific DNA-methyltransferase [Thermodesulfobacteriota bacterium]